ncbi:MAG: hypothetical protein JJLCMIEE_02379 [Acidimicrobiales bacterium]|nr:MAG: hypothetical protein EDR02_15985 [Actinomycetota bacterium]MBV6509310.1 hypothetical protein [Acidimicrobiales bacterium]RIK03965.1 MAG: hypothetical protein DCC48_14765 [Acidobacteriota bacterium]
MSPLPTRRRRRRTGIAGVLAAALALALSSAGPPLAPAGAQSSPLVIETIGVGTESQAPPVLSNDGVRLGSSMAALDADTLVYFGGSFVGDDQDAVTGDTWLLDGGIWTPVCGTAVPGADQACGPAPRALHAMGQVPGGGVLLFGGSDGFDIDENSEIYADTWLFDGSAWAPICGTTAPGAQQACGPGPRAGSTMMESQGQAFLFGGLDLQGTYNDTWAYTGSGWKSVNDGHGQAPGPRVWSQGAPYGDGNVLFSGGIVPHEGGDSGEGRTKDSPASFVPAAGSLIYSPSPSPLQGQAPTYLASASPLSFSGNDYTNTGPGGGPGNGATFLAAGEWFQGIGADNTPLHNPTGAPSSFDVALVDYGSAKRGTVYIQSNIFDQLGLNHDCAGASSVLNSYGQSVTCENFKPSILQQPAYGANFNFSGYGGFQNGGPVAEVNAPPWTPGTDPFVIASGMAAVDHQGPCCGQPDYGAMFAPGLGLGPHWIWDNSTKFAGLDSAGALSSVHVGLISVNGADLTFYAAKDAFVAGGYQEDCKGLIRMWRDRVAPQPEVVGCRNFKQNIFVPNGPGEDYTFTGFGGFVYPASVSETPLFAGDGPPKLVYVDGPETEAGLLADTWLWNPIDMAWNPVCGTKISGADHPCGPQGRLGAGMSPIVSLDPSLDGALMVSGIAPLEEGAQYLGDIWLFSEGGWHQQQSPWNSVTLSSEGSIPNGTPVPLGIRTAALPGDCQVAGFGLDTEAVLAAWGQNPADISEYSITLAFGFDTTGEGEIDPCPQTTSTPGSGDPGAGLAFTGAHSLPLALLGAVLVLSGMLLARRSGSVKRR